MIVFKQDVYSDSEPHRLVDTRDGGCLGLNDAAAMSLRDQLLAAFPLTPVELLSLLERLSPEDQKAAVTAPPEAKTSGKQHASDATVPMRRLTKEQAKKLRDYLFFMIRGSASTSERTYVYNAIAHCLAGGEEP